MDNKSVTTNILIIGFGFLIIPLLKELKLSNTNYIIISEGKNVWSGLEANKMLDFDLVSSMHSSMYSFELINQQEEEMSDTIIHTPTLSIKGCSPDSGCIWYFSCYSIGNSDAKYNG